MRPPLPVRTIARAAAWPTLKAPVRLTATMRSKLSSVMSVNACQSATPAFEQQMSSAAEVGLDTLDELVDRGPVGDVCLVEGGTAARLADALDKLLPHLLVGDVVDRDVAAFLGERERYPAPDAPLVRGAGDERDLPCEPHQDFRLASQAFSAPALPRRTTSRGSCFQRESSKS